MNLPPRLVALTPGDLRRGGERALLQRLAVAADGGLRGLLVREEHLADAALLGLARAARDVLGSEAWIGISDRAHLGPAAGADGVHLGFRSLAPDELVPALRRGRCVGLSTHAGDEGPDPAEVDYAFHGPLRDTPSKAGLVPTVGVEGLRAFCAAVAVPVWALGGVRPEDIAPALAAGARGVAVLRGVLGSSDPAGAAAAYLDALGAAPPAPPRGAR